MNLDLPFWFKQRQAKIEEMAPATFKVVGPNLKSGVMGVQIADNLKWQAFVKEEANGPNLAATEPIFRTPEEATAAAFELFRNHFVT